MQSPKISLLKSSLLPFAALCLILGGCMAVDESKNVFDFALADDYKPIISRDKGFLPKRLLVLPVSGEVDQTSRQIFETELLAWLEKANYWTVVPYAPEPGTGGEQLSIDRYSAYKRAHAVGADAIVFVNLSGYQAFSPIKINTSVSMEKVDTETPAMNGQFIYDSTDVNVQDSARRYYQDYSSRTFGGSDAPNRSLAILQNNEEYLKFCGAYTGKLIDDTFVPPPPPPAGSTPAPQAAPPTAK